jgi:glycerol-3-phosphate acyltransferase PlsY
MLLLIFSALLAYLIGSLPFGYIFAKLIKGIDIRDYGSGNIGATNAFRVIGKGWAGVVLLLDAAKGFLVVTLLASFCYNRAPVINIDFYKVIMAIAVISGHNWTIFLGFKGGKGVATSLGALLGICPLACGLSLIVWAVAILVWRYVSLASLVAVTSLPVFVVIFYQQRENFLILVLFSVVVASFAACRHSSNIRRLLQGKERKVTEK